MKQHIKPVTGKTVINPNTQKPLPENGESVEMGKYWQRRLNDQDVTVLAPTSKKQNKGSK